MIHILPLAILKSWKLGATMFGSMVMAIAFVAADTSPYTPWILAALVPIGLFISGQLIYAQRTRTGERDKLLGRLAILETQITPFWASLQATIGEALHHPHPESLEKDALLEKLEKLTIKPSERERLEQLLIEVTTGSGTQEEKTKARILMLAMPLVVKERHRSAVEKSKIEAVTGKEP